jgi:hypothetical protein
LTFLPQKTKNEVHHCTVERAKFEVIFKSFFVGCITKCESLAVHIGQSVMCQCMGIVVVHIGQSVMLGRHFSLARED